MTDTAQCPHYAGCSAPICPADAAWRSRRYLKGETICRFVRHPESATRPASVTSSILAAVSAAYPKGAAASRFKQAPAMGSVDGGKGRPLSYYSEPSLTPLQTPLQAVQGVFAEAAGAATKSRQSPLRNRRRRRG